MLSSDLMRLHIYSCMMSCCSSVQTMMTTLVLLSTLLTSTLNLTGATTLGVAYGRNGDNLPSPREVVDLYKTQGIKGMRIYYPNQDVLQALRGSDIELLLGVPNEDLQNLASDSNAAKKWVLKNVLNCYPDVKIKYIAVGNEVTPVNGNKQYASYLVAAMTNLFNAVKDAGLFQKVRVSTSLDTTVIENSYPPSTSNFRSDVMWFMNPVIGFLHDTRQPIMFSIYPYFAYIDNPKDITLSFALFTENSPEFTDYNNLGYSNLFDAMLDGVYSSLEKANGASLRIVISESGWPTHGRPYTERPPHHGRALLGGDDAPSNDNSCTYNQNLIHHVTCGCGSPKKPRTLVETYVFSMFNDNMKDGLETEQYFGLFYPNKASVCGINFHKY